MPRQSGASKARETCQHEHHRPLPTRSCVNKATEPTKTFRRCERADTADRVDQRRAKTVEAGSQRVVVEATVVLSEASPVCSRRWNVLASAKPSITSKILLLGPTSTVVG